MDITPSSSRALRQRLWGLFTSHAATPQSNNTNSCCTLTSSPGTLTRALTKPGFNGVLDALARRSTFLGLFIGSEDDAAICGAAAQLRTPATRETIWQAARERGRRYALPLAPPTPSHADPLASNDHFAEDDFFGRTCYRGDLSPTRTVTDPTALSDLGSEGTVAWEAFHAAVVLHLYDHHGFVHSFLASEVAALRCGGATVPPTQGNGPAPEKTAAHLTAAPDLRQRPQPVPCRRPPHCLVEEKDTESVAVASSSGAVSTPSRRGAADPPSPRPPLLQLTTEWRVSHLSPTRTPTRALSAGSTVESPRSRGGSCPTEDAGTSLPPPWPKPTQQQTAVLSSACRPAPLRPTLAQSHLQQQRSASSNIHVTSAAAAAAAAVVVPVVSCPSVSVSLSSASSSSCGPVLKAVAVAAPTAAAAVVVDSASQRLSSPSPAPRRPEDALRDAVMPASAAFEVTPAGTAAPAPRGLRLCSPLEVNTALARAAPKSTSRREDAPAEPQGAAGAFDVPAGVRVRKPKLACAGGTAQGPRRLYTTRRPQGGGGGGGIAPTAAPAGLDLDAAAAGSRPLMGLVHRPAAAAAEAWTGRQRRDFSIELAAPPTTRHEDPLTPSQRTPSPSPCLPQRVHEADVCGGRSGTVEHAVEGRRTTAMPVQVLDRALAVAGRGGSATPTDAAPWRSQSLRYASPEKPPAEVPPSPPPPLGMRVTDNAVVAPTSPSASSERAAAVEQPPTQTSRRRVLLHHPQQQQQFVVPQPSPFSTTREPFARASPTPVAVTGTRQGSGRRSSADRLVTAPSPSPTPREVSVQSADAPQPPQRQQQQQQQRRASGVRVIAAPLSAPSAAPQQPRQQRKQHPHSPRIVVPAAAAAAAPVSPSQLIGVPHILSSTFTSPRASAGGSLGCASTRQHHTDPQPQQQQQREVSEDDYRTPPRHCSPDEMPRLPPSRTPASPRSSTRHLTQPLSPSTPSHRLLLSTSTRPMAEVTTPPPRLSHRARVRSSSRGGRAAPTPPRVPVMRMLLSPAGSLQVTPRRRAPSTASRV